MIEQKRTGRKRKEEEVEERGGGREGGCWWCRRHATFEFFAPVASPSHSRCYFLLKNPPPLFFFKLLSQFKCLHFCVAQGLLCLWIAEYLWRFRVQGILCFGLGGMGLWIDRGLVWFRVLREMEVMNVRMRLSTWANDSMFRSLQCIL